jgi:hypothetical protein
MSAARHAEGRVWRACWARSGRHRGSTNSPDGGLLGEELNIYVDLLSEEECQRRIANLSELSDALRSVWSE